MKPKHFIFGRFRVSSVKAISVIIFLDCLLRALNFIYVSNSNISSMTCLMLDIYR